MRQKSCVYLNKIDPNDRQYTVWARLPFPTYESQVLFYCAFVALKRQDSNPSLPLLKDYFPGETLLFSGIIEDDNFIHKLKMLQDVDTRAIRLEASPWRGPMVNTPIWTAFITEHVRSRRWARQVTTTVVELDPLKPYIFCHAYTPPRVARRSRLNFTTRNDADTFMLQLRQF